MQDFEEKIKEFAKVIKESKRICVFTGAGISVPSGIPDFRSATGLYSNRDESGYAPELMLSRSFFNQKPEIFYNFYKNKIIFKDAKPNIAHKFFALLQAQDKDISIVTQNIDGLHTAAGNKKVIELHGSVYRNYCTKCGKQYTLKDILASDGIPYCALDGTIIRPDVVLYEESLDNTVIHKALEAIAAAELLVVVGTSLTVHPAASMVNYFKGKNIAIMNKASTFLDNSASFVFNIGAEVCTQRLAELLDMQVMA